MEYIQKNKEAWEEAFEVSTKQWKEIITSNLKRKEVKFLEPEFKKKLESFNFKNQVVGQFCCNNGRELFDFIHLGATSAVGFDIAQNMVDFANDIANENQYPCKFVQANILELEKEYEDYFDFIVITVGAITWFDKLQDFFKVVERCLKKDGILLINEAHPVTNMIASKSESEFDENNQTKLAYSYFKDDPWIENGGMGYLSGNTYESKTFTSYSHTLSSVFNGISDSGLSIQDFSEYERDISNMFGFLNQQGIPLSYVLVAKK